MLDANEINAKIAELESGTTTFSSCAKPADLYTVRANFGGFSGKAPPYEQGYSAATPQKPSETIGLYGDSDFLNAIHGKDSAAVWAIYR